MRIALVLLLLAAVAGAGLWLALADERPAAAPLAPELAPLAPPAVGPVLAGEQALSPRPVAPSIEARLPAPGAPAPRAERPRSPDEFAFVETPEPGLYQGPIARETFENGQLLFEGQQILREDGIWVLDGDWTSWHENGEVQERGTYRRHQEHGLWEWFDDNGVQIARGEFVDGARVGPWTFWYEDGTTQMDGFYQDGVGEGPWVLYDDHGVKRAEGNLSEGAFSGHWTVWGEDGAVDPAGTGWYEGGEKVAD